MGLSTFPFLTVDEFDRACRTLADRCISAQDLEGWSSLRLVTPVLPLHWTFAVKI